jgi:hypothetical protein
MANRNLGAAKKAKDDEFYTELSDIEKELRHYARHFVGKTVLCNCDDPRVSNFFHYFSHNFEKLRLRKLVTTCYQSDNADLFSQQVFEKGKFLIYEGDRDGDRRPGPDETDIRDLAGNGDFRSDECVELLKEADIVVTNPPFSLFREHVQQVISQNKHFVIVGNHNAISYREIFSLIKEDKIWLGYTHPVAFKVPDHYEMRAVRSWRSADGTNWRSLGNACWFTNLDIRRRHEELLTVKRYDPTEYPEYDNYLAIEVCRYKDIPVDYDGIMGVPITFLEHYNPAQFEIIGSDYEIKQGLHPTLVRPGWNGKLDRGYIEGRRLFARILIRRRPGVER